MRYDAIIIGSGQAGNPLSHRLADLGWTVALIEKSHLGGTCINTGCTPTKTMVHRAQVAHYARHAARWGVQSGQVGVDLPRIVSQKDQIVQSFRDGQQRQVDRRPNLRLYRGHARFVSPHRIKVGEALLESEKIFIDTGARPRIPSIPGLDTVDYLNNERIMELTQLPVHLIILGGGYVGLEFGQMFHRFGSRVTVIHHSEQILPREDPEVAAELQKALAAEGVDFLLNTHTTAVEKRDGSIILAIEGSHGLSTVTGSDLLVATGRLPNSDDLGVDQAGIETDKKGFIKGQWSPGDECARHLGPGGRKGWAGFYPYLL